jgi:hypothetical protein
MTGQIFTNRERNLLMKIQRIILSLPLIVTYLAVISSAQAAGGVSGKVTAEDQTSKASTLNASAVVSTSNRAISNGAEPGHNGPVQNVVVFVYPSTSGKTNSNKQPISIAHDGCHFTEAVLQLGLVPLAPYTGQNLNSADEEVIPVKCDSKPGMRKFFVVMKPSHHSLTGQSGSFALNDLAPGKYTITAWNEAYGAESQEVIISGNEIVPANFVFRPNSKI